AAHIAQHQGSPEVRKALANSFSEFFNAHNPRFDHNRFHTACKLGEQQVHEHDLIPAPGDLSGAPSGSRARVTGVNPDYNRFRTHGIPPGESDSMVGRVGQIAFEYYPVGLPNGVAMYRVLFPEGGMKDLTSRELAVQEAVDPETLARRRSRARALRQANVQRGAKARSLPTEGVAERMEPGRRVQTEDGEEGIVFDVADHTALVAFDTGEFAHVPYAQLEALCEHPAARPDDAYCGECGATLRGA